MTGLIINRLCQYSCQCVTLQMLAVSIADEGWKVYADCFGWSSVLLLHLQRFPSNLLPVEVCSLFSRLADWPANDMWSVHMRLAFKLLQLCQLYVCENTDSYSMYR